MKKTVITWCLMVIGSMALAGTPEGGHDHAAHAQSHGPVPAQDAPGHVHPEAGQQPGAIKVSHAWVRANVPGQTVASAFAVLENTLDKPLVLQAIQSPAAKTVELHSHAMVDGQMRMRRIEQFVLPAHGRAVFRPGENHIMLMGLGTPLKEQDKVKMEWCFDQICSTIEMPVVDIAHEGREGFPGP